MITEEKIKKKKRSSEDLNIEVKNKNRSTMTRFDTIKSLGGKNIKKPENIQLHIESRKTACRN